MYSRIDYLAEHTAAPRTKAARVIRIDAEGVAMRNRDGWKFFLPLDRVVAIDGKPLT